MWGLNSGKTPVTTSLVCDVCNYVSIKKRNRVEKHFFSILPRIVLSFLVSQGIPAQTHILRLVSAIDVVQQLLKQFLIVSNCSKSHKFKSWFQLSFTVAGR